MRLEPVRLAVALLCGASLASVPASGGDLFPDVDPFTVSFEEADVVPDEDLAHLRGRYVEASRILNFGVEMVSQWETPGGEVLKAGLDMNVDLSGSKPSVSFRPTVSVEALPRGGAAGGSVNGGTYVVSGDGLANAKGVVQGIRVAGDGNVIDNAMGVRLSTAERAAPGGSYPNSEPGTFSVRSASGAEAQVSVGGGSIDLRLTVPQQGEVLQRIGDATLRQDARISGDMHRVSSRLTIDAQLRPNFSPAGLQPMLQGLPLR